MVFGSGDYRCGATVPITFSMTRERKVVVWMWGFFFGGEVWWRFNEGRIVRNEETKNAGCQGGQLDSQGLE